jgi:ABC-type dipeptide/oligopeptide/nickel transport system ATPase component
MIAMALACNPSLLIADEPTTALDVTIQAQILELMLKIKDERKDAAILLITHNLAVVAETCHRVIVMYGGKIQEIAPVHELFKKPLHPVYTGSTRVASYCRWRKTQTAADHSRKCSQHPGTAGGLQVCDAMSGSNRSLSD